MFVLQNGIHCNDLTVRNAEADEGIRKAHTEMIRIMKAWVAEFPKPKNETRMPQFG